MWRGIRSAHDSLLGSLRMQIGNGNQTSIWVNAWLQSEDSGSILLEDHPILPSRIKWTIL